MTTQTQSRATRVAAQTKARRQPQYKAQRELVAQLKAYAKAHASAIKNGTPRPLIKDFVG